MKVTKQKIIYAAIKLFNQKGLVNVRLQQIADETGISVGNLAYHFYSKKAIIQAIDKDLETEIMPILLTEPNFSYLIDFDNHLASYYYLIKHHSFYFLDLLEMERAYPALHAKRKDYIQQMISQLKKWMDLNVNKEVFKPEIQENHYQNTAHTIWIIITFWFTQGHVSPGKKESEGAFKEMVWNQLIPFFTEKGRMEYEAFILPQLKYFSD